MSFESILSPGRTHRGASVNSKKRLLELISELLSKDDAQLSADELFNNLLAREKLGSTGIGHGVAIPHCRSEHCQVITGMLLTLDQPIDFESIDDQPVDLVFALIVPNEAHDEHVKVLGQLATAFNETEFRQALRNANSDQMLYQRATA